MRTPFDVEQTPYSLRAYFSVTLLHAPPWLLGPFVGSCAVEALCGVLAAFLEEDSMSQHLRQLLLSITLLASGLLPVDSLQ